MLLNKVTEKVKNINEGCLEISDKFTTASC